MAARVGDAVDVAYRSDMHDERVETRPGFRVEDASHGLGVEGVGSEAVDGFRGEGDQPSMGDAVARLAEVLVARTQDSHR